VTGSLFGIFFALMLGAGAPLAICMGISSLIVLVLYTDVPAVVLPQRIFVMLDSFPLMAVPYFVLAGVFMEQGGISTRLVDLAKAFVGHFKGGIALVTVFATMIFSGLSGSGAADVAAIGAIMIPALIAKGYTPGYAAALQGAAGALGPIIPPSIIMVLYAALANQSPAKMFLGGILPGLAIGIGLMVICWLQARRMGIGSEPWVTWPGKIRAVSASAWALGMPVLVLGGIITGVFTATEAGVAAAVYALFVGLFVHREIRFTDLPRLLYSAASTSTLVMFIVGAAGIFAWLLALAQAPIVVQQALLAITDDPFLAALIVVGFLIIAGGFMDIAALIVLFVPVLHPLGQLFGYDGLQWAVTLSIALVIGGVTPPVADFLFISTAMAKTTLRESTRYVWPFLWWMIAVNILCLLLPGLTLWLPNLLI
jgi:C4-dicarboxylate transporter DctM subunit